MINLLAVYGTLMKGMHNNSLLDGCKLVEEHVRIPGAMFAVGKSFPAFVHDEKKYSSQTVRGELWEIPSEEWWKQLDRLEGYKPENILGSMYIRRPIYVEPEKSLFVNKEFNLKSKILCQIYEWNSPCKNLKSVVSGSWRSFVDKGY